jgi:formylglycine-generating enzyme required for sulfatase activity
VSRKTPTRERAPQRRWLDAWPVLVAFAVVLVWKGLPWWRVLAESAPVDLSPPERLRCGAPEAEPACFVRVEGGSFLRGAQADDPGGPGYDPAAAPHEGPVRQVRVSGFWLQQNEVNVGTWRACVAAGACEEAEVAGEEGYSTLRSGEERSPLNSLSWTGASQVCAWLGGRLPTETEWEFAARGPEGRRWPWGNEARCPAPDMADPLGGKGVQVPTSCAQDGPVQPALLPHRTPGGLTGMGGNLWEWTADWYAEGAYADGSDVDPPGPTRGDRRVQRGGSWTSVDPLDLRAAARGAMEPTLRLNDVGARCAFGGAAR